MIDSHLKIFQTEYVFHFEVNYVVPSKIHREIDI